MDNIVAYVILDDKGNFLQADYGQTFGTLDEAQAHITGISGDESGEHDANALTILGLVEV